MGRVLGSGPGLVADGASRRAQLLVALRRAVAHRALVAELLVTISALILYWRTVMPDVGFWDTAEFQAIGPVLGIAHPTGYPAYTLLAWFASVVLQPFGNEALRANLLSAIVVAIGCGLVAATVTRLTNRLVVGAATGLALAVSSETWSIGLRADPHALHLMLAALVLLLLVVWADRVASGTPRADRWLFAAAVVFGVSLANHALTYLLAPGIALYVLAVQPGILRRPRLIVACALGLAVTTVAIYAYLPIRSAMNPPMDYANPETWEGFRYLVFAEQFRGTFQALPGFLDALRRIGTETLAELGLFALLAIVGVVASAWRRPALTFLLTAWFAVNWFFALGYINADIGRYYLVPILAAAVFGGMGAGAILDSVERLLGRVRRRNAADTEEAAGTTANLATGSTDRFASVAVTALAAVVLLTSSFAPVPSRYGLLDASSDRVGRRWLAAVMTQLPENSVVMSWWSYSTTLWYGKYVDRLRPDVTVIDDSTIVQENLGSVNEVIDSYLGRRPMFLIRLPHDLPQFEQRYVLTAMSNVPGGPVYRVDGMRARSEPAANL